MTTVPYPGTTSAPVTATVTPTLPGGREDCGDRDLDSGAPTTTVPQPGYAQCILAALAAGRPAVYIERQATDDQDGHDIVTTYTVVGRDQVQVRVDATGAQPPGQVTTSGCAGLTAGLQYVSAHGCGVAVRSASA